MKKIRTISIIIVTVIVGVIVAININKPKPIYESTVSVLDKSLTK